MRLSIETEFYLATRNNQKHLSSWWEVARILMDDYNRQIGFDDPLIEVSYGSFLEGGYRGWHIDHDSSSDEHEIRENSHIWCKPSLFRMILRIGALFG